jgi:hypothetical protein
MNDDALNPYAAPAIPADATTTQLPPLSEEDTRRRLKYPAYGLFLAGAAGIVALLVTVPVILIDVPDEPPFTGFADLTSRIVLALLQFLTLGGLSLLFLRAGLAMRQLRNYSAARWGAVIGIATCGGVAAVGLPFAVWAFVLLRDERIRSKFRTDPIQWLPLRAEKASAAPSA